MTLKDEPSEPRTWFIADAPLSDADKDAFGHPDVANNLLTMLREPHLGRRMIGLLGSFGVGKSSVVELLGKLLTGDKEYALIRVSAERHEIENFHRSFVFSVAEAILDRDLASRPQVERIISRLEYSTTQSWSDVKLSGVGRLLTFISSRLRSKLGKWLAIVGGIVLAVLTIATLILIFSGFFTTDTASRVLSWTAAFIGSLATTLAAVPLFSLFRHAAKQADPFKPGQSTSMRPRAEAADEYERVFASLAELVKPRLVIAVDDVDRLDQHEILPALNAIRSFQLTVSTARQPTFIVSLDDTIIAKALVAQRVDQGPISRDDADLLIDEYLNRLFTLRQIMPLHARRDLRAYARELLVSTGHRGAEKLGDSLETVLNILIHDEVQSPRHVIRLLNGYFADYRLAMRRERGEDGRRAISAGLVTSAPAVLARMTVLKNDFPTFFAALVVDTQLVAAIESDVRGTLDATAAAEAAEKSGLSVDSATYASLKRFIGRTATWTEPIEDLLPFLYLGQDSLERSMGSADARRVLSVLSNRQIAEFGQLLVDASGAPDEQRGAYAESIVDAINTLGGLELANSLATIVENAESANALSSKIADAVSAGIVRAPATDLSTEGLAVLLQAVSSDKLRDEIAGALSNVPDTGDARGIWTTSVLDHDAKIAAYPLAIGNVRTALRSATREMVAGQLVEDLESYASHLRADSDSELAEIILSSTLEAFAQSENDLTEAFANASAAAAASLPASALSTEMNAAAVSALRSGATSNGALAALRIVQTVDLTVPKQLADLSYAYLGSATTPTRDALVDGFKPDHLAPAKWLLTQTIQRAPGFTAAWGAKRKATLPRQIAEVLALSIDAWNTIYPSGNEIVATLLRERPSDATPVVASAARLVSRATEEIDSDEQALLEHILGHASDLSDEGLTPLQSALRQALLITGDKGLREQMIALLPPIRTEPDWEPWLEKTVLETAAAADSTLASVEAAADVVLAASPPEPSATAATAVHELIRTKMIPYRHYAPAVRLMGSFDWPEDSLAPALEMIAPVLDEGDEAAIESVFRHLGDVDRGGLTPTAVSQIRNAAEDRLDHAPAARAMIIRHLPLEEGLEVALTAGHEGKTTMLEALDEASSDEITALVEGIPAIWVSRESSAPLGAELLTYIADLDQTTYVDAVVKVTSDFMANDDSVIVPGRLGELADASESSIEPVAEVISSGLAGAAHEVLTATRLLGAVGTSSALDKKLSAPIAAALWRWSREELDRDIAIRIADAARAGSASRSAAQQIIGPRGPRKEPAKTIYLDVRRVLSKSE
ncbi:P-loop NTPase fold protein [Microbacterium sp. OVT16B]|uniref:P-loop NTPase fold protein n=1 Tax=Microbacterium sp. OVT16B TaxID=2862682 RepID=UPI001CBA6CCE|nr:P-loop NTPase fold protein [Microbacterium sp. OVT16B]